MDVDKEETERAICSAGGCLPSANIMGTNEPWRKSALRHVLGAPVRARRGNRRDLLRADNFTGLSSADVRDGREVC